MRSVKVGSFLFGLMLISLRSGTVPTCSRSTINIYWINELNKSFFFHALKINYSLIFNVFPSISKYDIF